MTNEADWEKLKEAIRQGLEDQALRAIGLDSYTNAAPSSGPEKTGAEILADIEEARQTLSSLPLRPTPLPFLGPTRLRGATAFEPRIPIRTSQYVVKRVKSYRRRKRTFTEWFWRPWGYWPYTPVELYEEDVPSAYWFDGGIVCHPALEDAFRRALGE